LSRLLISNSKESAQLVGSKNVSRNSSVPVEVIENLPEYIKITSDKVDFIAIEITKTSIDFWDYLPQV
jgi:hypothetical protein